MKTQLEEGDLVLCTVTKIVGTTVFVKTDENQEGTIITSEISPGRIRNIRDYVVPNKKIVCKVLKVDNNHLYLSLRRVNTKEKKEVLEKAKQEKIASSILKTILKEKSDKIVEKIKEKEDSVYQFLQKCKLNAKELEKYITTSEAKKICKILADKKEKVKQIKKEFNLSSKSSNGIKIIKNILLSCKGNCKITYIAAGKYSIKIISNNYKKANQEINSALEKIKSQAKKEKADFFIIEKKK